jgi:erythromycin esterase-like protein
MPTLRLDVHLLGTRVLLAKGPSWLMSPFSWYPQEHLGPLSIHGPCAARLQVLEQIPESADFVLLGEASHGTHEFYQLRADITKLLIQERGFNAVATEAGNPEQCLSC